jgi:hypothetical protein
MCFSSFNRSGFNLTEYVTLVVPSFCFAIIFLPLLSILNYNGQKRNNS